MTGNSYIPVPCMMLPVVERGAGGGEDVAEANWPLDALWKDSRRVVEMDRIGRIDLTRLVTYPYAVHHASDSAAPKLLR